MASGYVVGQQIRLTALFTTSVGAPVDPTTVVCKVKDGAGTEIDYPAPVRDSTGVYHQDITITKPAGTWYYRFEGTGAAIGAGETSFGVQQTVF
jgi:hypothetical protein